MSGEPEHQSTYVLLVGFYRQTRLPTFGLFAVFPEKTCENMNPAGRGHQRCASELAFFLEKTWGIWKQRNYWNRLVGVRNLGMLLGASRGPPGGFPGPPGGLPEPPGVPKYAVFMCFYKCFSKQATSIIGCVALCAPTKSCSRSGKTTPLRSSNNNIGFVALCASGFPVVPPPSRPPSPPPPGGLPRGSWGASRMHVENVEFMPDLGGLV